MLDLSSRDRCFVIAEAGTCHAHPRYSDRLTIVENYIKAAKEAGVDAIKFQIFDDPSPESMFCWFDGDEKRQFRWLLSGIFLDHWRLAKECAELGGLIFLCSTFEYHTVAWLSELDVKATKVASRAAKNFPYDNAPAPFLISTGMGHPGDLLFGTFLECEANYPSTAAWQGELTGFSDHSGTPWRAIDAISRGCKLVEVHFYIDEIDAGPDLPASLNVDELKLVCEARDAFAELRRD